MDNAVMGSANPLQRLGGLGQSPWLDFIRRSFLTDGSLARLVAEDGLGGVTSNPAIFEKAIAAGAEYHDQLAALAADAQLGAKALYEALAIADIQHAADILRPVYDRTGGRDGFVSLEVSPYLATDTAGTIAEARRLWAAVDRPNLMVKVPGTPEGVPAIRALIEDGLNINVTLLFAQSAYQAVAEAFFAGLEARIAAGLPVGRIASVASFFVSRIDVAVDAEIDRRVAAGDAAAPALLALRGKVAIACAQAAYDWYLQNAKGPRWAALDKAGAQPQRLLWASTGTKDPAYSDVLYVEALIGRDTVNTLPPATLDAFRDHGAVRASLPDVGAASRVLADVARLGLDLPGITAALVDDGVRQFTTAFDTLLGAVAAQRAQLCRAELTNLSPVLPAALQAEVSTAAEDWRRCGKIRRLWAHDASLWTGGPEAGWLGWLRVVQSGLGDLAALQSFQADVKARGFSDVLLIGMGGSSLGPEVLGGVFGQPAGFPKLHVLDSTDPQQIATFEARLQLPRTLVIVSSKSGTTLEPSVLMAYFWSRLQSVLGDAVGSHFIAVTDPGSALQKHAETQGFWHVFLGHPAIGGRFSVLSNFGLVPAAAAGIDLGALLRSAARMVASCDASAPPAQNPAVQLGLILGRAAQAGRDKLTIFAAPGIAGLGAWLEQLIAESTGKQGLGIIPVDGEALAAPAAYGKDRIFVQLRLADAPQAEQDAAVAALSAAGHPLVCVTQPTAADIGQQFFLWEIATAVAGSVLGIDPFDQPDVEASKIKTRALTTAVAKTGALPAETPFTIFGDMRVFVPEAEAAKLGGATLAAVLRHHFGRIGTGDYFAALAYIEQTAEHLAVLDDIRLAVRASRGVAAIVQFGPRFLHSTGQCFKGGPATGVFLQITADDAADIQVPGAPYSFGVVKAAEARGDFEVLAERGRRALRVHIHGNVRTGLASLRTATLEALA